jgi:hypothetical protein
MPEASYQQDATASNGAEYLHTTDALAKQENFDGWDDRRVELLLDDCVTVIERCASVRSGRKLTFTGLRPATITVVLKDFKRASAEIQNLGSVEHVCAVQAAVCCLRYGKMMGFDKFQFYFDQNEPFLGHIRDRINNRKSRVSGPDWKLIVHTGASDMRRIPALQAADILAWPVNHKDQIRGNWQRRLLEIDRDKQWLDYSELMYCDRDIAKSVAAFRLPRRKPMK